LNAISLVGVSFILAFILVLPIMKLLPKTRTFQKLVLNTAEKTKEGFRSTPKHYEQFIGQVGVSLSPLRPAGIAQIDDNRLDVVAEGEFIEQNSEIKVVKVEGYKIIVRQVS